MRPVGRFFIAQTAPKCYTEGETDTKEGIWMELQQGRPADCSGRLPKEIRVYEFLDRLGIGYQRLDHEAVMTMDACVDIDAAMGTELCKNLLLGDHRHTQFFLLMLPGEKTVKATALAKQIGSPRLHFADG